MDIQIPETGVIKKQKIEINSDVLFVRNSYRILMMK